MSLSLWDPWLWAGLGAAMMLGEMLIPGFLLFGFGVAAAAMGALVWLAPGALQALPYPELSVLLLWALVALAVWGLLARGFGRRSRKDGARDDINDFRNRL